MCRMTSGPKPSSPRKMLPIPATRTLGVTCGASSGSAARRGQIAPRPPLLRGSPQPPRLRQSSRLLPSRTPFDERFDLVGGEVQVAAVPLVQLGRRVVLEDDTDVPAAV